MNNTVNKTARQEVRVRPGYLVIALESQTNEIGQDRGPMSGKLPCPQMNTGQVGLLTRPSGVTSLTNYFQRIWFAVLSELSLRFLYKHTSNSTWCSLFFNNINTKFFVLSYVCCRDEADVNSRSDTSSMPRMNVVFLSWMNGKYTFR